MHNSFDSDTADPFHKPSETEDVSEDEYELRLMNELSEILDDIAGADSWAEVALVASHAISLVRNASFGFLDAYRCELLLDVPDAVLGELLKRRPDDRPEHAFVESLEEVLGERFENCSFDPDRWYQMRRDRRSHTIAPAK